MRWSSQQGVRGCVFAVPEYVRRGSFQLRKQSVKAMRWPQLQEWVSEGHEVGSHTFSHAALPYCGVKRAQQEMTWSKQCLEDRLGVRIAHFAYPWGLFDHSTETAVRQLALYDSVSTRLRGPNFPGQPTFRLRRNQIHPAFSPEDMMLRLRAASRFHWVWRLRSRRRYLPQKPERFKWHDPITHDLEVEWGLVTETGLDGP